MRILINGLRKQQGYMIKKNYPQFKIKILDDSKHHKSDIYGNFDLIINITKFANHSFHNSYKKHKGYTMVSGVYSSVTNLLNNLHYS